MNGKLTAKMPPIFISFYTGEPYKPLAHEKLIPSLKKFSLEHDVEAVADLGSWEANCAQKASFIFRKMAEYEGRDVVWIDADAEVLAWPEKLFRDASEPRNAIRAHYSDLNLHRKPMLYGGTVLFSATIQVSAIVLDWMDAVASDLKKLDQEHLQDVISRYHIHGLVTELPAGYHWIDYAMKPHLPNEKVYINHFHVARSRFMK